jgi:hypothetical protein
MYAIGGTSFTVSDGYSNPGCHESGALAAEHRESLFVMRVTPDGAGATYDLESASFDPGVGGLVRGTLVPDPRGGVHASWSIRDAVGGETTKHQRVGPDVSAPVMDGPLPFDRIGDGVGFDASGVAYDLDTSAVKFSPPVAGTFITSLGGGGVALTDGSTLTELDDTGAVAREARLRRVLKRSTGSGTRGA